MKPVFEKPKLFISHGRAGQSLDIFRSYFEALNFDVIVVIDEPNLGMALSEKVKKHIKSCDCIVVIATPDNKDEESGLYQPRANVSHEIGYAEALLKPIIYIKHKDVNFGSNYGDKVWISFSEKDYHKAFLQILEEFKKLNLISILGKINNDSIKSEIVERILRLIDILNVSDNSIKSNILYYLSVALYNKSQELTTLETKEFFEIYPEYTQTCAYDGYKNENLYNAIKLLSFSLQLDPESLYKSNYIFMLSDALYIGEGMLDDDIKKELNTLLISELRKGDLFQEQKYLKTILFFLDIFEDKNRYLFWAKISQSNNINEKLVSNLKYFLFSCFTDEIFENSYFTQPRGFPIFLGNVDINNMTFQLHIQTKIKDSNNKEKQIIFKFLSKYFDYEDLNFYISILNKDNEQLILSTLWLLGQVKIKISNSLKKEFLKIFDSNNQRVIGILATALGKIKTKEFNNELIKALNSFQYESRRRIIWAMGQIKDESFIPEIKKIKIEENNFALQEEIENTLNILEGNS